jgi:hypothetical protein
MTLANTSRATLTGFDYGVALVGHGGAVPSGASHAVGALANTI